jgi:hypothetical protein
VIERQGVSGLVIAVKHNLPALNEVGDKIRQNADSLQSDKQSTQLVGVIIALLSGVGGLR